MTNRRGRRPRGGATHNTARLHQEMQALKNSINGRKTTPSAVPRAFVQIPWNSWTFERTNTTNADLVEEFVTINDIATQLRNKIGLDTTADLRIKIHSAQIWATVSSTLLQPDLTCRFYEINGESSNAPPRCEKRDLGTLNMPAKCGYIYPSTDQREIIRPGDSGSARVCSGAAVTQGTAITTRVQILWQQTVSA